MFNFSEQFFANRQSQVDAQLALFSEYGARAMVQTEKLLDLNLRTSRAAFDKSAAALHQLFAAQDPRDLISLTTQGQQHFESLMAYGQALIGIAAGAELPAAAPAALPAPVAVEAATPPAPKKSRPIAPFPDAQLDLTPPKASRKK